MSLSEKEQHLAPTPAQGGGHFINGKAQVVEILKAMNPEERERLLKNIRMRNPTLAKELVTSSVSFDSINKLNDQALLALTRLIPAQIMGLALKTVQVDTQRRLLKLADRSYAEEAYEILTSPIQNEMKVIQRAQDKVLVRLVQIAKAGNFMG